MDHFTVYYNLRHSNPQKMVSLRQLSWLVYVYTVWYTEEGIVQDIPQEIESSLFASSFTLES